MPFPIRDLSKPYLDKVMDALSRAKIEQQTFTLMVRHHPNEGCPEYEYVALAVSPEGGVSLYGGQA